MSEYHQSNIVVLEGLETVRRRPGMYVGDVSEGSGLHHLLWEALGNAIDEHLAGHASRVAVQLRGNAVSVDDDGRGIPVTRRGDGASFLELVFTTLHSSGTADAHTPHVHLGASLHRAGIAVVNALSSELAYARTTGAEPP